MSRDPEWEREPIFLAHGSCIKNPDEEIEMEDDLGLPEKVPTQISPSARPPFASSLGNYDLARDSVERFSDLNEPVDPDALMMASLEMRGDYLGHGGLIR